MSETIQLNDNREDGSAVSVDPLKPIAWDWPFTFQSQWYQYIPAMSAYRLFSSAVFQRVGIYMIVTLITWGFLSYVWWVRFWYRDRKRIDWNGPRVYKDILKATRGIVFVLMLFIGAILIGIHPDDYRSFALLGWIGMIFLTLYVMFRSPEPIHKGVTVLLLIVSYFLLSPYQTS